MIDFMVVALPRSGTAWLANWFTTERSICWHEPLWERPLTDLDAIPHDGLLGISDTQLMFIHPDELNAHPAKKLIVHRELRDVNLSLTKAGLPAVMADEHRWRLDEIGGFHITYKDLWNVEKFRPASEWLTGLPFDAARYAVVKGLNVQNTALMGEVSGLFNG